MKSKKAKETIQSVRFTLTDPLKYTARKYVNTQLVTAGIASMAVHQAEQDAEERAVKVFEQWGDTWLNSLPSHIREVATNSYKELLNGGQSDE